MRGRGIDRDRAQSDKRAELRRDMMHAAASPREIVGYALIVLYRDADGEEVWERWESCDSRWKLLGAEMGSLIGHEVIELGREGPAPSED